MVYKGGCWWFIRVGVGGVQGWVLVVYKGGCWWCTGVVVGGVQGWVLVVAGGGVILTRGKTHTGEMWNMFT